MRLISEHSEHSKQSEHSELPSMAGDHRSRYLEPNGFLNGRIAVKNEYTNRCEKLLQVWMPEVLADAISSAASKNFQSKSEYVRQGAIERLKADGIDPANMAGAV